MLQNNNQNVIKRQNKRMLKQNKLRNFVAIVAIVLTTFMFTSIFTMGFSVLDNINMMLLRGQGNKACISLASPTDEQIRQVRELSTVDAAGIRIQTFLAEDIGGQKRLGLTYYDKIEFEQNFLPAVDKLTGTYPVKENEIMLSRSMLTGLGMENPFVGDEIHLLIENEEKVFVLSGFYTGFSTTNPSLVSESFCDANGFTLQTDGALTISSKDGNMNATLEELESKITLSEEQEWYHSFDVREEERGTKVAMIVSLCLISSVIVVSGYLLIYNVMYISVGRDIRFYGMLKTIGTSTSQIQKLVKYQARLLSVIGIPIGLILGTLASFGLVPVAVKMFGAERSDMLNNVVSFHPAVYLFSIGFSVLTVSISAKKPAKLAGKVSPMEALRYFAESKTNKQYRTTKKHKVFSMAYRNVFRDRKKARLVFASLFMGSMIFLCVNTFIKALDADSFVNSYFYYDYVLYADSLGENDAAGGLYSFEEFVQKVRKGEWMAKLCRNFRT